jgi:hypothetical protein
LQGVRKRLFMAPLNCWRENRLRTKTRKDADHTTLRCRD